MISVNFAANTLLFVLGILFVFHCLILLQQIPPDIVWAGKIKNQKDLLKLESISLVILLFAATIIALKMGYLEHHLSPLVTNVGMWILLAFFTLNTIGNLTAKHPFEKYGFGFLTLVMVLLILRIVLAA